MTNSTTRTPAGPAILGLELGADADVVDGAIRRTLTTPDHLHGPEGILQGGLAAGVLAEAARLSDTIGAPITALDARLHKPTPLGRELTVEVRQTGVAGYEVVTRDGDTDLVSGTVELAGHEVAPQVADLAELGGAALPTSEPQHRFPVCWVCGPDNDAGLGIHPAWHAEGMISSPFIGDLDHADERGILSPLVVSSVLDCPTVWASLHVLEANGWQGALLAGYHVRYFADAPAGEPLRTVARFDALDGRKIQARGALVDESGIVYAVSSCLHIGVSEVPTFTG